MDMTPPYNESTVFSKIWFAGQRNGDLELTPSEVFILNEYLNTEVDRAHRRFIDDQNRMRHYRKIKRHEVD